MGAPLYSGRKHEFAGITGLRESEAKIIEALYKWNYQQVKANPKNIAITINISYATVWFGLEYLKHRGLVQKSIKGSWFLPEFVKESISKVLLSPENKDSQADSNEKSV